MLTVAANFQVSDPNLNLPAGQKDKVKKLIAAQPEPPVQVLYILF